MAATRTIYGPNKYAALHLLLARWLRHHAQNCEYRYVSLGGTELRDIQSAHFIDPRLATQGLSFEVDHSRFALAEATALDIGQRGINVLVEEADVFDYERGSDHPHLYFVDLEGVCASADFHVKFAQMFQDEIVREGDALFITSYLGRNIGWDKLFAEFDGEFRTLGITDPEKKKLCYKLAHPSFTLYRSLTHADVHHEVALKCIGSIEYRDSSSMGLYGYTLEAGMTAFRALINNAPFFRVSSGYQGRLGDCI